jgi:hypothetical protein
MLTPRPPVVRGGRMSVADGFFARRVLADFRDGKVHFGEAFSDEWSYWFISPD